MDVTNVEAATSIRKYIDGCATDTNLYGDI